MKNLLLLFFLMATNGNIDTQETLMDPAIYPINPLDPRIVQAVTLALSEIQKYQNEHVFLEEILQAMKLNVAAYMVHFKVSFEVHLYDAPVKVVGACVVAFKINQFPRKLELAVLSCRKNNFVHHIGSRRPSRGKVYGRFH